MMDIYSLSEKVIAEIKSLNNSLTSIATIGTTAKESSKFLVLPRRKAFGFQSINFLVSDKDIARKVMKLLDGNVQAIMIDVEAKKNLNLWSLAREIVVESNIIAYKPNDATVEATDLFLRHYYNDELVNKNILIFGSGNLAGKVALRLVERNSNVFIRSRNYNKARMVAKGLNLILPRENKSKIIPLKNNINRKNYFDAVISFVSAEQVIGMELLDAIKKHGLVLDGGINNFSEKFFKYSKVKLLNCFRLDVRIGFAYSLLVKTNEVKKFFKEIKGERKIHDVRIVAGGIIGNEGDIIVDNITNPSQVIGIANGIGGLKDVSEYTERDNNNIKKVTQYILSYNKANF